MSVKIINRFGTTESDYDFSFLKKHEGKLWIFLILNAFYLFGVLYGFL